MLIYKHSQVALLVFTHLITPNITWGVSPAKVSFYSSSGFQQILNFIWDWELVERGVEGGFLWFQLEGEPNLVPASVEVLSIDNGREGHGHAVPELLLKSESDLGLVVYLGSDGRAWVEEVPSTDPETSRVLTSRRPCQLDTWNNPDRLLHALIFKRSTKKCPSPQ
jgi:hypothetical protein